MTNAEPFIINEKNVKLIDRWVKKYPKEQQRSAVVAALRIVQDQNGGWLSESAMQAVANHLSLAYIEVYEVASFYDQFELAPIGRHKISFCTNLSCQLRGVDDIVAYVEERVGARLGETSADGVFTLREAECLGACDLAPMCQVNDREYRKHLTPEKMDHILAELRSNAQEDY
jgi:NADH-quinone oxidoreductase subunit E